MFYGWVIVGICFAAQFVALGTAFYSFGPLIAPLEQELGTSRQSIMYCMSFLTLVGTLGGPLVGVLVDRGHVRRVMLAGALCFAAGVLGLARVQSIGQLWAVYALPIALGMALLGGVANPRLIASWFTQRLGTALGLAAMGVSISGVVVPRIMAELVADFGWRGAAQALALLPVLFSPLLLLVVEDPTERGLHPDGLAEPPARAAAAAGGADFGRTLRMPALWLFGICFALALAPNGGVVVQVYEHAGDLGLRSIAPWAVGVLALGGGIGKPAYGWLADRFSARGSFVLALSLMIGGLTLLLVASGAPLLLAACGLFGLGFAGLVPLQALLSAQLFGREMLGRVLGAMGPVMLPLTMGVHPFMGWIHDSTGSYALAFQSFIASCLLSGALLLLMRLPRASRTAVPAT